MSAKASRRSRTRTRRRADGAADPEQTQAPGSASRRTQGRRAHTRTTLEELRERAADYSSKAAPREQGRAHAALRDHQQNDRPRTTRQAGTTPAGVYEGAPWRSSGRAESYSSRPLLDDRDESSPPSARNEVAPAQTAAPGTLRTFDLPLPAHGRQSVFRKWCHSPGQMSRGHRRARDGSDASWQIGQAGGRGKPHGVPRLSETSSVRLELEGAAQDSAGQGPGGAHPTSTTDPPR